LAPGKHDRWWICCSDSVGPDGTGIVVKANIRSLTGAVSDSRCPSVDPADIRHGYRRDDTAEIVAVEQIGIAIFAQGKHELRRRSSRHVNHRGADTAKIGVAVVEAEPIRGCPVISRLTAPGRAGLQADDGLAAHPIASGVKRVSGDHKHVSAIAGNAAMAPYSAASCCGRPAVHV